MSIIVWDGKVLATDNQVTTQGRESTGCKAWYDVDYTGDCILSGIGEYPHIMASCEWYLSVNPDKTSFIKGDMSLGDILYKLNKGKDTILIVVNCDGLRYYTQPWRGTYLGYAKCAFGIGADFAYGALHMGATAEQAVEAANKHSVFCGHGVSTYTLPKL